VADLPDEVKPPEEEYVPPVVEEPPPPVESKRDRRMRSREGSGKKQKALATR
jgi:hypothetical protein